MPDFGLTEALSRALEASKKVPVVRSGEARLAAMAGNTAPEAAAPVVPSASPNPADMALPKGADRGPPGFAGRSVQTPPAEPAPGATQESPVNPSQPPAEVTTPPPVDPAAEAPAPPDVAASAADAAPPSVAPVTPEEPVAPAPTTVDPEAIAPNNRLPPEPVPEAPPARTPLQESAARFVDANMGDFKGKLSQVHMPNVDVMDSPEGVKAAILQVADDNRVAVNEARRGTITDEQLTGLAQDIAANTDVVKQVLSREFGTQAERPEVILAARMVEQQQVGVIKALAENVADGTATSAEIAQYEKSKQVFSQYVAQLMGAKAEQGRGLRALGLKVGDTPQAVLDHVASVLQQNNPDMQAEAAAIKMAMSPGGVANIVNGMQHMPLWQRAQKAVFGFVQRTFINGILWGPQTWAKIFTGNNLNLAINSADLYAAGIYRNMVGLAARLGEYPTAQEGVQLSDAYAHMHGVISSGADALRVAGLVARTGQSLDGVLRSGEGANAAARGTIYEALPELQNTYFGAIWNGIDQVFSASGSRIIGPIDSATQMMGYRGYLTMMQLKELRLRMAEGTLKPGDAEQVMQELMQNPSEEMQQAADLWGKRMSFQTPFPEGGPGEAFQNLLNKAPALRFIFPFMRTATNIFKQSVVERTPLAVFSARLRAQIANGGFEGDLAKARIATGTAILGMFAWMAIHDRITGSAPKDPKERAAWELDGRTPYSIRVTNPLTGKDTWREYMWMEPVATLAGITADAVKLQAYINGYDETDTMMPHEEMLTNAIEHIAASVITNTTNKTFMMGAAQASEAYNDPMRAGAMWADQVGASLVPMSGLTKFGRNIQDPYMRQAFTLIDKIKDELPTVAGVKGSKTLPARLDLFGEPRVHKGGNDILGPLSPMPGSPSVKDDLVDEIQSVMEKTRTVPITMPSKQLAYLGNARGLQDGQGMRLTPEEYNDYVQKARASAIFDGGTLTFREKLEQTIASPVYQEMSPANRSVTLTKIANQADALGRKALWDDNTDFRERMIEWTAKNNRLKLGQ